MSISTARHRAEPVTPTSPARTLLARVVPGTVLIILLIALAALVVVPRLFG